MKMGMGRIANAIFFMVIWTMSFQANGADLDTGYNAPCLAPLEAYKDGLPTAGYDKSMTVEARMLKMTADFRSIMAIFQKAQSCHGDLMANKGTFDNFVELYTGMKEIDQTFEVLQVQFQERVEDMSVAALSAVEPAAGFETQADVEGEEHVVSTMETLLDSYMVIEQSEDFRKSLRVLGK